MTACSSPTLGSRTTRGVWASPTPRGGVSWAIRAASGPGSEFGCASASRLHSSTTHHREDRARTEGWAVTPAPWGRFGRDPGCGQPGIKVKSVTNPMSFQRGCHKATRGQFGRDPDCEQSGKEEKPVTNSMSFRRGCLEATCGQFGRDPDCEQSGKERNSQ